MQIYPEKAAAKSRNPGVIHVKQAPQTSSRAYKEAMEDNTDADTYCVNPITVLGVQQESPLAISPDGHEMAFVTANHGIYVLNWHSDRKRFEISHLLSGHHWSVKALTFHPTDPNMLLSGGNEGIFVWDIEQESLRKKIEIATPGTSEEGHEADIECFCWAYEGAMLITGSKDANIKVWDVEEDFRLVETLFGHKAPILSVVFSPEKEHIASAGRDSSIKLFDGHTLAPSWRERRKEDKGITCALRGNMDGHRGDVTALCWSRDGRILFSGARDNTMKSWDATTLTELRSIEDSSKGRNGQHNGDVNSLILIPGERLPPVEKGNTGGLTGLATAGAADQAPQKFYQDGLLSGAADGTVMLWRISDLEDEMPLSANIVTDESAEADQQSSQGWDTQTKEILEQILKGGDSDEVLGRESSHDVLIETQPLFSDGIGIANMIMSPNGSMVLCSSDENSITLYDASELQQLRMLQGFHGHRDSVTGLYVLDDDQHIITTSYDNQICRYDVETVERSLALRTLSSVTVLNAIPSSDGSDPLILAGCADYTIRCFSSNPKDYASLVNSYHAQWVQAGSAGSLKIPQHAYECSRYVGHSGRIDAITINPQGTLFVSGGRDFDMLVWSLTKPTPKVPTETRDESEIPNVEPLTRVDAHFGHITGLSFCDLSVGSLFASGGNDHAVKVWKVNDKGRISKMWEAASDDVGHKGALTSVAWGRHESANVLFSAGWDLTLKIWDGGSSSKSTKDRLLTTWKDNTARITGLSCSRDGRYMISVSNDFSALLYQANAPFTLLAKYMATTTDGGLTTIHAGNKILCTGAESGSMRVWPMYGNPKYKEYFRTSLEGLEREAFKMNPAADDQVNAIKERTTDDSGAVAGAAGTGIEVAV